MWLLLAGGIERDSRADERLERVRVDLLTLMNVDRAPYLPSRLELNSFGGSFREAPLKKVSFTIDLYVSHRADAALVGPYRRPHPFPLFHNIRVASLMRVRILVSVSPPPVTHSAIFSLISLDAAGPAALGLAHH